MPVFLLFCWIFENGICLSEFKKEKALKQTSCFTSVLAHHIHGDHNSGIQQFLGGPQLAYPPPPVVSNFLAPFYCHVYF